MKVVVLYRPNSEHGRLTDEFIRNFGSRSDPSKLEALSIDTHEGDAMARLYDIMQYPAVLVVQTDGSLQHCWQGEVLPLVDEVISYVRA